VFRVAAHLSRFSPETGTIPMRLIKQLDLLKEVTVRYPDGVIEGQTRNIIVLIELGAQDFSASAMNELLKTYWQPTQQDKLYIINLEKIDVLTPSVAKILLESASDVAVAYKIPVLFSNVGSIAIESLESEAHGLNPPRAIWTMDEKGEARLVGPISNKFQQLLNLLEEKGPASASQIVVWQQGKTCKKAVGNVSVYLQKLFSLGLVGREKVTALEREDAQRGWTYSYQTAPTIKRQVPLESYLRKP
jgi:hypothetical protein